MSCCTCNDAVVSVDDVERSCVLWVVCRSIVDARVRFLWKAYHCTVVVVVWMIVGNIVVCLVEYILVISLCEGNNDVQEDLGREGL